MFISNNHHRFTCGERKIWKNIEVSNYYENDCRTIARRQLTSAKSPLYHQDNCPLDNYPSDIFIIQPAFALTLLFKMFYFMENLSS